MLNISPSLSWAEYMALVLEDYMRRMVRAGYGEVYRHGVLKKAISIYDGKLQADREGNVTEVTPLCLVFLAKFLASKDDHLPIARF